MTTRRWRSRRRRRTWMALPRNRQGRPHPQRRVVLLPAARASAAQAPASAAVAGRPSVRWRRSTWRLKRRRAWRSRLLAGPAATRRCHASTAEPSRPRGTRSEKRSEKKAKRAPAPPMKSRQPPPPQEGKLAGNSKPSAETAVERANRLFTEGRWAEAAAAYRELLRRDPNNSGGRTLAPARGGRRGSAGIATPH